MYAFHNFSRYGIYLYRKSYYVERGIIVQKNSNPFPELNSIPARIFLEASVPVAWCAAHRDTVLKLMSLTPCGKTEREEIESLLLREGRFELLAAMALCDAAQNPNPQSENLLDKFTIDPSDGEPQAYEIKRLGQLYSFLRWCDEKEETLLVEGGDGLEQFRLLYLAVGVGYSALAVSLAARLGAAGVERSAAALKKYAGRETQLFRSWLRAFYARQPEGREKRKLGRRLVRCAPPSVQPLRL